MGDDTRTRAVQGALRARSGIRRSAGPTTSTAATRRRLLLGQLLKPPPRLPQGSRPAAEPLVLNSGRGARAARARAQPRRRSAAPLIVVLLLVVALGAAAFVLERKGLPSFSFNEAASSGGPASAAAPPPQKPAIEASAPHAAPSLLCGRTFRRKPAPEGLRRAQWGLHGPARGWAERGPDPGRGDRFALQVGDRGAPAGGCASSCAGASRRRRGERRGASGRAAREPAERQRLAASAAGCRPVDGGRARVL